MTYPFSPAFAPVCPSHLYLATPPLSCVGLVLGLCRWVAKTGDTVAVSLVEFDFLISKSKIEEGEDFTKYINPNSRAEVCDCPACGFVLDPHCHP